MSIDNGVFGDAEQHFEADKEQLEFFRGLVADGNLLLGTLGFSLRIDRSIPTMAFSHKSREVLINPDFLEQAQMTKEEKRYVFGHEIAHFVQLVQDSDSYLATFTIAKDRAKKTNVSEARSHVEKAWNRFYNVFLDIHDNSIVDARSMWTQGLSNANHPRKTLYQKLTQMDLRGAAKTEQFNFAILRKVMLGVMEDVQVDEDVAVILDRPFKYGGKTFPTVAHFVRDHFFDPKLSLQVFLSKLERTISPIFETLIENDIETGQIQNPGMSVDLTGGDLDGVGTAQMVDEIKKSKESGSDRAKREANAAYAKKMLEAGVNEQGIAQMQKIRERTQNIIPTLQDLWDAFVQKTIVSEIVKKTGFVSGEDMDLDAFVRELPTLYTKPDQARFMERSVNEPVRETEQPKAIQLFLILDLSGSMDQEKRQAVQEVAYALSRSLLQYQLDKKIKADDFSQGIFDVNLRLIGFGNTHKDLFIQTEAEKQTGYVSDDDPDTLETRLVQSILSIHVEQLGGTNDDGALGEALEDLQRPEHQKRLENDDSIALVVEVTDGETMTAQHSQEIVRALNKKQNVFARGIRIPGLLHADQPIKQSKDEDEDEVISSVVEQTGAFASVWGKNGKDLSDLAKLKEVMVQMLVEALLQKEKNL